MGVGDWVLALGMASSSPVLDVSSLVPSARPVARSSEGLCTGQPDDVLAMAVVVYGRRRGRSRWGHISLRFLACEGEQLRDVEFESTRADRTAMPWFATLHPDEEWHASEAFLRTHRDRLILFRNEEPVDGGAYYEQLERNREIVELWGPWRGPSATAVLRALDAQYDAQLEAFRAGLLVPGDRYGALSTNCTQPIRQAVAELGGVESPDSVFPFGWRRSLAKQESVVVVVHPSEDVLMRLEEAQGDLKGARSGARVPLPGVRLRRRMPEERFEAFRARILDSATSVGVHRVASQMEVDEARDGAGGTAPDG